MNKQAELDNLVMEELNVKQFVRKICTTELGNLELIVDRGTDRYYFTLDSIPVSEHTQKRFEDMGLLANVLFNE